MKTVLFSEPKNSIIASFDQLANNNLLTHNEATAAREIDTVEQAKTWLGACALELQEVMEPPTFAASLSSRIDNVSYALRHLPAPDGAERIWQQAATAARQLNSNQLATLKEHIAAFKTLDQ